MRNWYWALFFMGLSRASVAVSSVLNWSTLLKHVDDRFRGRVFSTIETMNWSTMMLSMLARRNRLAALRHPAHRRRFRSAQFVYRHLLGMGELDWQAAGTRSYRR